MNKLTAPRQAAIIQAFVEGSSIRATCRMTATAKGTVLRLVAEIGEACYRLHDPTVRNIKAKRLQADEIWSFCHAKARNVPESRARCCPSFRPLQLLPRACDTDQGCQGHLSDPGNGRRAH